MSRRSKVTATLSQPLALVSRHRLPTGCARLARGVLPRGARLAAGRGTGARAAGGGGRCAERERRLVARPASASSAGGARDAPGAAAALPSARIAHRDAGGRRRQALVWRSDGAAAHRRGAGAALALRRGRDAARGSGAGHGRGRASAADGDARGGAPRARREGVRYGGGGGGAPQGARQGRLARQPHTRRGEPSQPLVIRPVMRLRSVLPPRQACVSPLPSVFQVWEIVPIAVTRHPGRKPLGRCPCLCGHSDVSRLVAAVCQSRLRFP
mmetsp:Transcript_3376/g.9788  ORF Transcript_3376/g.9788 Transcript_3376/m.9788 type:complete len:270 (+) Transcript_3376:2-811(+)